MTKTEDFAEPADLLLHDLRRFLHDAADQQETLTKIAKVMGRSASTMKEQESAQKRILQNIQKQIDDGVVVKIDADLKAHVSRFTRLTEPLSNELQQFAKMIRYLLITIALTALFGGGLGSFLGVFAALRLL